MSRLDGAGGKVIGSSVPLCEERCPQQQQQPHVRPFDPQAKVVCRSCRHCAWPATLLVPRHPRRPAERLTGSPFELGMGNHRAAQQLTAGTHATTSKRTTHRPRRQAGQGTHGAVDRRNREFEVGQDQDCGRPAPVRAGSRTDAGLGRDFIARGVAPRLRTLAGPLR